MFNPGDVVKVVRPIGVPERELLGLVFEVRRMDKTHGYCVVGDGHGERLLHPEALDVVCCRFHGLGGTRELSCGGDVPNESGRHSRSCAVMGGGDCTCGAVEVEP